MLLVHHLHLVHLELQHFHWNLEHLVILENHYQLHLETLGHRLFHWLLVLLVLLERPEHHRHHHQLHLENLENLENLLDQYHLFQNHRLQMNLVDQLDQ